MTIRIATTTLSGISPYSSSKAHETERLPRETGNDYEARTWREKSHYNKQTRIVFIPAMAFKMALDSSAQMLGMQIPGKGKATYTKFFKSGILVLESPYLGIKMEDTACERIYANADGRRGSGKRVWRMFPSIESWSATVAFHVLAPEITPDVFQAHLEQAGQFIGLGRFRPQSGGFNGRFTVKKIAWS